MSHLFLLGLVLGHTYGFLEAIEFCILRHEHHAGEQRRPYLDGKYPTLAEVVAQAGYATGGFVANVFWCGRQTGLARGFVHYDDLYANGGDALVRTVLGRLLDPDELNNLAG
ncbi:MAG: hypothetical protein ABIS17_00420 [Casimicrobiaceae bacterium]